MNEEENLKVFLQKIVDEIKKPHYDREDDLNSYYRICNIIEDAKKYLEKKGDRI